MKNTNIITSTIEKSITTHGGKLEGLRSISTSVLCNTICCERSKDKSSICAFCYARNYAKFRSNLARKLERNFNFYTKEVIYLSDVPKLKDEYFRFESFGDLQNELQFKNYCTIAEGNKGTRFVLWSKNLHIIRNYCLNGGVIPSNLFIIMSSPKVNQPITIDDLAEMGYLPYVDAVFTVYEKEYAEKNGITINCGGNKCMRCMKCYTLEHGKITMLNELKK